MSRKKKQLVSRDRSESIMQGFDGIKLLVVGDMMLDVFIRGQVDRISPEAPVPIVKVIEEISSPGGAANTVRNIYDLGAQAYAVGRIGDDTEGRKLVELFHGKSMYVGGIVPDPNLPTTTKTRIIANNQHIVRVDREEYKEVAGSALETMLNFIEGHIFSIDGVIVSDYLKGVITPQMMRWIIDFTRGNLWKPVVVDPKSKDFQIYRGADYITPNRKEAAEATGMKLETDEDITKCGLKILDQVEAKTVLLTKGEHGMSLFQREEPVITHIPTHAKGVYDVSGAGDTVATYFALAMLCKAEPIEAAYLANVAAGIVVGKLGTATATREEVRRKLSTTPA